MKIKRTVVSKERMERLFKDIRCDNGQRRAPQRN